MSEELTKKVIQIIAETQRMPAEKISPASTFQELGIDSLDGINILFALENEFNINIPDDSAQTIRSVGEMIEGVQKLIDESAGKPAAG
ncbi:MAG: acyl carrier protein [Bryobacterales bacterium]|nr:acyl carrier protein [Bryobacterales bacterium]